MKTVKVSFELYFNDEHQETVVLQVPQDRVDDIRDFFSKAIMDSFARFEVDDIQAEYQDKKEYELKMNGYS